MALLSETPAMRTFWWVIMIVCIMCGTVTTTLVILEYVDGPTATSTTIRLVDSLELPAITICPKIPDAFNSTALLGDIRISLPEVDNAIAIDLVKFWIGGNGLENMDDLSFFNRTYMSYLSHLYHKWSYGHSTEDFFKTIQEKYGYSCDELFYECQLAGRVMSCCNDLFKRQAVMRRGICYQTRKMVNQTEADDIGRLIISIKAPPSVTSPQYNYIQPQIVVYITDNFEHVVDFPRFYLYPHEWNRMRFTARYIELIESEDVCTPKTFGKDAQCVIRKWLLSNIIYPFNCTLSYLEHIDNLPPTTGVCAPEVIVENYYNNIQLVWNSVAVKEECIPGCHRWDYKTALQQTQTLSPFSDYTFNLEVSFNELQYEYLREVYTTSVPGFMSQIGGQFGFFLGLSIITLLQMILYGIHFVLTTVAEKSKRLCSFLRTSVQPANNESKGKTGTLRNSHGAIAVISRNSLEECNSAVHQSAL
ncbi:hypothetical protein KIN20_024231 [Parelaphostrongylus tenuis]|uniref:Uncharacterized protein n=1 Tax=Parelaphostrongylus tenuis TaxID=148309 RepID=A0AAD5MT54_PARTN|nr:hypothetical protein KIN20_024231 [Parelaphostrongylus tenuis]